MPPGWYVSTTWLTKASLNRLLRLMNSWPTLASRSIAAMVSRTQATASSSSSYGAAVRSGLLMIISPSDRLGGGHEGLGVLVLRLDRGQLARLGLVPDLGELLVVQRVLDEDQHGDQCGESGQQADGGLDREDRAGRLDGARVGRGGRDVSADGEGPGADGSTDRLGHL